MPEVRGGGPGMRPNPVEPLGEPVVGDLARGQRSPEVGLGKPVGILVAPAQGAPPPWKDGRDAVGFGVVANIEVDAPAVGHQDRLAPHHRVAQGHGSHDARRPHGHGRRGHPFASAETCARKREEEPGSDDGGKGQEVRPRKDEKAPGQAGQEEAGQGAPIRGHHEGQDQHHEQEGFEPHREQLGIEVDGGPVDRRQQASRQAGPVAPQPGAQAGDGVDGEASQKRPGDPSPDDAGPHRHVETRQEVVVERGAVVGFGLHPGTHGDGLGPGMVIVGIPPDEFEEGVVACQAPEIGKAKAQGEQADPDQHHVLAPGQAPVEEGATGAEVFMDRARSGHFSSSRN